MKLVKAKSRWSDSVLRDNIASYPYSASWSTQEWWSLLKIWKSHFAEKELVCGPAQEITAIPRRKSSLIVIFHLTYHHSILDSANLQYELLINLFWQQYFSPIACGNLPSSVFVLHQIRTTILLLHSWSWTRTHIYTHVVSVLLVQPLHIQAQNQAPTPLPCLIIIIIVVVVAIIIIIRTWIFKLNARSTWAHGSEELVFPSLWEIHRGSGLLQVHVEAGAQQNCVRTDAKRTFPPLRWMWATYTLPLVDQGTIVNSGPGARSVESGRDRLTVLEVNVAYPSAQASEWASERAWTETWITGNTNPKFYLFGVLK